MTIANATPALESTITSLRANLGNLRGRHAYLAEGILKTIDHTHRVSEAQIAHVVRLEKMSKKKRRGRKQYRGYFDGARYVSAREQEREDWRKRQHEERYKSDPEYAEAWDREQARQKDAAEIFNACALKGRDAVEREYLRNDLKHYHRSEDLRKALPEILTPHLLAPTILRSCLIRRLRMLRAEGIPPGINDRATALRRIRRVRACLIAEGVALLRDRQTIRNLQAAE